MVESSAPVLAVSVSSTDSSRGLPPGPGRGHNDASEKVQVELETGGEAAELPGRAYLR